MASMRVTRTLELPWASTVPRINLGVGDVAVVEQPTVIWTVLGSCIAVILHVPRLRLSAVCHAQLPEPDPRTGPSCIEACTRPCSRELPKGSALRYVTCCIRSMFDELSRRGALKIEMVASVIGGANVVALIDADRSTGDRNVAVAQAMLAKEGIPVVFSDTGGEQGRSIEHDSATNHTAVRYHESRL